MDTQILLDNLDIITEAPNGVESLRNLVLRLAVEGRLVPQDPRDSPAKNDLQVAKAAKAAVIVGSRRQPSLPRLDDLTPRNGGRFATTTPISVSRMSSAVTSTCARSSDSSCSTESWSAYVW
jgi:hypothetical protein